MSIESRLRRIEAAAGNQPAAADQAYLDWHLAVIGIVYENDDEAERLKRIDELGPKPPAVTESARAFERALEKAYGGNNQPSNP